MEQTFNNGEKTKMEYKIDEINRVLVEQCSKPMNVNGKMEKWSIANEYEQLINHYDNYVALMAFECGHRNNDNWKKWFYDVAKPFIETKYKNSFVENRLNEMENDFTK